MKRRVVLRKTAQDRSWPLKKARLKRLAKLDDLKIEIHGRTYIHIRHAHAATGVRYTGGLPQMNWHHRA